METATERILKKLRAQSEQKARARQGPASRAWMEWEKWTPQQRRHFLTKYCNLSTAVAEALFRRDWYSLSLHVKVDTKRFFKRTPVVDVLLGEMRYPKEEAHAQAVGV